MQSHLPSRQGLRRQVDEPARVGRDSKRCRSGPCRSAAASRSTRVRSSCRGLRRSTTRGLGTRATGRTTTRAAGRPSSAGNRRAPPIEIDFADFHRARRRTAPPLPVGGCSFLSIASRGARDRREIVAGQDHPAAGVDHRGVEAELVFAELAGQHDRVGIVPPQAAVLPVAAQVLPRGVAEALPVAADVVRAARAVDHADRRPDRMVAAEDERVAAAAQHRRHAAPIGLDARRARIVEAAAVNRAPEVGVELEIRAAPLVAHRREDALEMRLRFRMRAVERVPRATAPAAERDAIGAQRLAVIVFHEPVGMLLEEIRALFGDERRHPDRRLESAIADLLEHRLHLRRQTRCRSRASRPSPADSRRRSGCSEGPGMSRAITSRLSSTCFAVTFGAEAVPRAPA